MRTYSSTSREVLSALRMTHVWKHNDGSERGFTTTPSAYEEPGSQGAWNGCRRYRSSFSEIWHTTGTPDGHILQQNRGFRLIHSQSATISERCRDRATTTCNSLDFNGTDSPLLILLRSSLTRLTRPKSDPDLERIAASRQNIQFRTPKTKAHDSFFKTSSVHPAATARIGPRSCCETPR